jgi:hypothetical protein
VGQFGWHALTLWEGRGFPAKTTLFEGSGRDTQVDAKFKLTHDPNWVFAIIFWKKDCQRSLFINTTKLVKD